MSDFEKGREAGVVWAREDASRLELEKLNAFRWGAISQSDGGSFANWFNAPVLPPYSHAGFIASVAVDDCEEMTDAEDAAVHLFGLQDYRSVEFIHGFVEGACKVLWDFNKLSDRFAASDA